MTIENAAASAAYNVRVSFDPALPNLETDDDGQPNVVGPCLNRRYASPVGVLASRHCLNNVYRAGPDAHEKDVPNKVTVSVAYEDGHGKRYYDVFPLALDVLDLETYGSPGRDNNPDVRRSRAVEAVAWQLWE